MRVLLSSHLRLRFQVLSVQGPLAFAFQGSCVSVLGFGRLDFGFEV